MSKGAPIDSSDSRASNMRISIKNRKCTDIFFLVLFLTCWVLQIIIFGFVIAYGDLDRLQFAQDYTGGLCNQVANFPLSLYPSSLFSTPIDPFSYAICSEECYQNQTILCNYDTETQIQAMVSSNNSNTPFNGIPTYTSISNLPGTLNATQIQMANDRYNYLSTCIGDNSSTLSLCPEIRQNCWAIAYESFEVFHRCIPELIVESTTQSTCEQYLLGTCVLYSSTSSVTQLTNGGDPSPNPYTSFYQTTFSVYQAFYDLIESLPIIALFGIGVALFLSLIFVGLFPFITWIIVYMTLFLAFAALLSLSFFSLYKGGSFFSSEIQGLLSSQTSTQLQQLAASHFLRVSTDPEDQFLWKVVACVLFIITAIYVCVVAALWSRIRLAIALTKCASQAMLSNVLSIFVLPLVTAALLCGLWIYSVYVSALTVSMQPGEATLVNFVSSISNMTNSINVSFSIHDETQFPVKWAILAFVLLMLLWTTQFILNSCNVMIALATSKWYWTENPSKGISCGGNFGLLTNCYILVRFHLGTVSFGSFLVALLQFIRAAFEFLRRRIEGRTQGVGQLQRVLFCMIQCCLWCIERVLAFITDTALILTAIEGLSFCSAASKAVSLVAANSARYFTLAVVTRFVMFTLKLLIALCCSIGFYLYLFYVDFDGTQTWAESLSSSILPVVIVFVLSYLMSAAFMHVFSVSAATIFLSFVLDEQKNGSASPFAPKGVRKLMTVT